ncbi:GMC family oxidoreductase [Paludisphaera sp.]|uniref:GMC family oxidoreductase n=1 Tax=Paludisphaera sp. TaxID=2017432 RepID=UPI00301E2119
MKPRDQEWDVAVIGAGMGGGTVGHALAEQGYRVLFIERGASEFGRRPSPSSQPDDPDDRLRDGRWPTKITSSVDGVTRRFFAPMGCGVGGSTLLYPAALERFRRSDFHPTEEDRPGVASWPISYDRFLPYYERAERLYRVRGTPDPLDADDDGRALLEPWPLNAIDSNLFELLKGRGLHPYQSHLAAKGVERCDLCPGRVCHRSCKNDSRSICVEPVANNGRCEVLDHCEVTRLEADRKAVRSVLCTRKGRELRIRAKVVILSAGAYMSPKLLLASRNEFWPRGVGNDRDQVGRHIMFHLMSLVAIWPSRKFKDASPSKSIGLRDFYSHEGHRLGLLQSMGVAAGYGNIVYAMRNNLELSRLRGNRLAWHLLRVPAFAASRVLGRAAVFAAVIEDLPYPENRVVLDPGEPSGIRVEYRVSDELRRRDRLFRDLLKRRLKGVRSMFLNRELALNYGHPCGSCRSGTDPATSVVDPSNRVHGLANLYIVDGSFMPSSAGANPGLTIAANAIRVGDIIHRRLAAAERVEPAFAVA